MYANMVPDILKEEDALNGASPTKVVNESSQSMEAGYMSLFETEGQQALDTFWKIKDEQKEMGKSPTAEGIRQALHDEESDNMRMGLTEFVSDQNVPVEQRTAALQIDTTSGRKETPVASKLMDELLVAPDEADGLPATEEQETVRSMLAGSPDRIANYRIARHNLLEQKNLNKPELVGQVADFAQVMIPFVEQGNVAEALSKVGKGELSMGAFFAMGHTKKAFFDSFQKMSLAERTENIEKFASIIKDANTTNFMTNELLEDNMLQNLLYGGSYTTFDKWFDDAVSWFDLSILGKPVAWAASSAKAAGTGKAFRGAAPVRPGTGLVDMQSDVAKNSVRSEASEVSPIRMASEVNEERAKVMFKAVAEDETGEAAQALGGASRAEVIADAVMPEMAKDSGVRSKVENIEGLTEEAKAARAEIIEASDESAVGVLTTREMEIARAHAVERMKEAIGVTSRTKMFQHKDTDVGAIIHGVYGPEKGGWSNPQSALDLTEIALREHGITRDELYLMERSKETGEYVRVDEPTGNDFLVGIDYNYEVKFSDVLNWDKFTVKRNFLDRSPVAAKAKLTRNMIDIASMLDPHLIIGANARVDKSAKVTKDFLILGDTFAKGFAKEAPEAQASIFSYLTKANDKQTPFSVSELKGEWGFTDEQVELVRSFRNYWDTVWEVRNLNDVKALRNKGFGVYEDAKMQDRLFTRPVEKGQVTRGERIYDPATGESKHFSEDELSAMYDKGTKIGKLRKPQTINGTTVTQMVVRNDNKWRGLRNTDIVHPYRHGYFQRTYTAPHYILKEVVSESGEKAWKPIAHAGSIADAEVYMNRLRETDPDIVLKRRGNIKDNATMGILEMDTFMGNGLSGQRVRGEKLEDATALVTGADSTNILGPVDAIIQSARSMGNRVGMGDYIDSTKQRFLDQYAEVLKTEKGQTVYPRSIDDIGAEGEDFTKMAADARSTYEYISFLEFGYVNSIDSLTKTVLKSVADIVGRKGMSNTEKAAHAVSDISPTSLIKNVAFQAYIATNPLRQLALNAHQSTLLVGNFPSYVLSQRLAADLHAMLYMRMGFDLPKLAITATRRGKNELDLMFKQYMKSGLAAAIDQSNLMRGALMDMAESSKYKDELGVVGKVSEKLRKVGFNMGEEVNLITSWLAHYDRANTEKKALTATDYLDIAGRARNFTLNMNRAGDMPYNHNSLSMFFMYMQFPHKSALQLTNRVLTRKERAALAGSNALLFSLPPGIAATLYGGMLPDKVEHPELHEAISTGLQFWTYNKTLELMFGGTSDIDFSSFSPSAPTGFFELIHHLWTTPTGEWVSSSPAGQLMFGGNPRLTDAVRAIVSYTNPIDPSKEDPTTFGEVMHEIASLSSGYSNTYKSIQQLIDKKAYGSRDQVLDENVTTPEAIAQLFGAPTQDSTSMMNLNMMLYKNQDAYREDIGKWFKQTSRRLREQDDSDLAQVKWNQKVIGQGYAAFGNTEIARQELTRLLTKDSKNGVDSVYQKIANSIGYTDEAKLMQMTDMVPDDDEERKRTFKEGLKFMKEQIEMMKEK